MPMPVIQTLLGPAGTRCFYSSFYWSQQALFGRSLIPNSLFVFLFRLLLNRYAKFANESIDLII